MVIRDRRRYKTVKEVHNPLTKLYSFTEHQSRRDIFGWYHIEGNKEAQVKEFRARHRVFEKASNVLEVRAINRVMSIDIVPRSETKTRCDQRSLGTITATSKTKECNGRRKTWSDMLDIEIWGAPDTVVWVADEMGFVYRYPSNLRCVLTVLGDSAKVVASKKPRSNHSCDNSFVIGYLSQQVSSVIARLSESILIDRICCYSRFWD